VKENGVKQVLENYGFTFTYPTKDNPNGSVSFQKDDIKKKINPTKSIRGSVISLMKTMVMLNAALKPLPDKRLFAIRIHYNQNAPADYQPTFFRDVQEGEYEVQKFRKIKAGRVDTGLHSAAVKFQIAENGWKDASEDESDSEGLTRSQEQEMITKLKNFVKERKPSFEVLVNNFPQFCKETLKQLFDSVKCKKRKRTSGTDSRKRQNTN